MPRDMSSQAAEAPSYAQARSDAALNAPKIEARGLEFFYGTNKALKGMTLAFM